MMNSHYLQIGLFSARPAQGNKGVWFIATDTEVTYYDNGSAWVAFGAGAKDQVSFFNLAACPDGWSEYTAMRGRYPVGLPLSGTLAGTVGTALSDTENRAVGQHTHTFTGDAPASHLHTVNPPSTATDSQGTHDHELPEHTNASPGGTGNTMAESGQANGRTLMGNDGAHTHTVDIAQFNSGSTVAATPTGTNANSGSVAGTPAPYIQLLACTKD